MPYQRLYRQLLAEPAQALHFTVAPKLIPMQSNSCPLTVTGVRNSGSNMRCPLEIHSLQWCKENSVLNTIDKLNHYEFYWIKKGKGVLLIDLQQFDISNKTVLAISPGQVRQLDPIHDLDGFYISLSPEFFYAAETDIPFLSPTYKTIKQALVVQLDENNQQELEYILHQIKKEVTHYAGMSAEILKGLFRLFLLYLSRKFTNNEEYCDNKRDVQLVKRFADLLGRHFKTKKMVIDYAVELCVTPSYLNQVVKKVSGFTASYHIQQCLVQEAKRQAILSGSSMKEIAYNLGFEDTAHFSKFFKINSGTNFSYFRKNIFTH